MLDRHRQPSFGACSGAGTHSPGAPLADGDYTFRARTTDAAGNSSTETRSFSVDTTAPDTRIDSGPQGDTTDPNPSFAFSTVVPEPGVTFQCRLDSALGWASCSSPLSYTGLPLGAHLFEVRASDALGNQDPTPDSRSFTIQPALAPPQPQEPQPSAPQPSAQPPFNLAKAIRRCRKKFDGKAERACIRKARAKARA